MNQLFRFITYTELLLFSLCLSAEGQTLSDSKSPIVQKKVTKEPAIDFDRARKLMQKWKNDEKLSPEEETFLNLAKETRRQSEVGGKIEATPRMQPREWTRFKPLTEMTASDRYKSEDGGLYGNGQNDPPQALLSAANRELARIKPVDKDGHLAANGQIGFVSISMSNATMEFSHFKKIADADSDKSPRLKIVDCAQGGQAMAEWTNPQAPSWIEADKRLRDAELNPKQVQVAWIKIANKGPRGELVEHGKKLREDTVTVIQNAKSRFPNLRIVYLSSRIYGGYAIGPLNPEPYAYESAFVVRWLIQDQMNGEPALIFDPDRGSVKAPLLLWGPYLWADGVIPRQSDQLVYLREDFAKDGTHPSEIGQEKIAKLILGYFKTSPLAKSWFAAKASPPY